jgi:hypothetical protein
MGNPSMNEKALLERAETAERLLWGSKWDAQRKRHMEWAGWIFGACTVLALIVAFILEGVFQCQ